MVQAEQDPDLPRSASNVLGKVHSHLCLKEWRGKWKWRRGKSTYGAAGQNVLQPMLHPVLTLLSMRTGINIKKTLH